MIFAFTQNRYFKGLFLFLHFGERNGNPLQYSCLENPRAEEPGGLSSMGLHRVGPTEAT